MVGPLGRGGRHVEEPRFGLTSYMPDPRSFRVTAACEVSAEMLAAAASLRDQSSTERGSSLMNSGNRLVPVMHSRVGGAPR